MAVITMPVTLGRRPSPKKCLSLLPSTFQRTPTGAGIIFRRGAGARSLCSLCCNVANRHSGKIRRILSYCKHYNWTIWCTLVRFYPQKPS